METKEMKNKIRKEYNEFILGNDHPCAMSQKVFRDNLVDLHLYRNFASEEAAGEIASDLRLFIDNYDEESKGYNTFIAVFPYEGKMSEIAFEEKLWQQLQYLHEADLEEWDREVSSDPEKNDFSFSFGSKAFYIVGMHPNSSRKSRQSPYVNLVFNLHLQFEMLREEGQYDNVRDKIRERDKELQGSVNPMLKDFGEDSEAKQYSGRKVSDKWKCPFHVREEVKSN